MRNWQHSSISTCSAIVAAFLALPLLSACAAGTQPTAQVTVTATETVVSEVTRSPEPAPTVTVTEVLPPEGLIPPEGEVPPYEWSGLTWEISYCNDAGNARWISVNFDNPSGAPIPVEVTFPLYDGLGVWPYTVIPEGTSQQTFSAFDIGMAEPLCQFSDLLTVLELSSGGG